MMDEELQNKILAIRTRMYKEIDEVLKRTEEKISQLKNENPKLE